MKVRGSAARVAAAAQFFAATTLLPALHLAFHRRGHDHVGGSIRFHRHVHVPGGPAHAHEAPLPEPARGPEPADPGHGEGAMAHFAAVLGEDAFALSVEVRAEPGPPAPVPIRDSEAPIPGHARPFSARGPPAA